MLAQETINGVGGAAGTVPGEQEFVFFDAHDDFFGAERGEVDFGKFLFGERAWADDDAGLRGIGYRVGDLEFNAGDLVKGVGEFAESGLFGFSGVGLGDDEAMTLSVFGDCEAGMRRGSCYQEHGAGQREQGSFSDKHRGYFWV